VVMRALGRSFGNAIARQPAGGMKRRNRRVEVETRMWPVEERGRWHLVRNEDADRLGLAFGLNLDRGVTARDVERKWIVRRLVQGGADLDALA
jgi:hypothetical protein